MKRANRKSIIILGVNGDLGEKIVAATTNQFTCEPRNLIGVDIQPESDLTGIDLYHTCDLRIKERIKIVTKKIGDLKVEEVILVTCAGSFGKKSFDLQKFSVEDFYESVQINLLGICQFIIMLLQQYSSKKINKRVVIVGSTASAVGSLDIGYGIAKAGLNGMVVSLSKTLAQTGTTVIGINPGIFESKMSKGVNQKRQKIAVNSTHIKRKGNADEIANLVLYAAFEAPNYLTGSIIYINGGQYSVV